MARLFALLQSLLPQHLISRVTGWLARQRTPWLKDLLIGGFLRLYDVRLDEAAETDAAAYPSFNAFFTRALTDGARPMPEEPGVVACPVDGTISQVGPVEDGELFQAKGFRYSLASLLGGEVPAGLHGGSFATLYLAPSDYHRIHCPAQARLSEMRYLPGRLFSVNGATVSAVPRLFARNERVACLFETDFGPMAVVLVGALNVGSIETVWAGQVAPGPDRQAMVWRYPADGADAVRLGRGEELGRFNLGSTVVVILPQGGPVLSDDLRPGGTVRLGQPLATAAP
ncbi:MAG: archaetidylserine decarboxylase [Gammaproteobacteria bacterium]